MTDIWLKYKILIRRTKIRPESNEFSPIIEFPFYLIIKPKNHVAVTTHCKGIDIESKEQKSFLHASRIYNVKDKKDEQAYMMQIRMINTNKEKQNA